MHVMMAVARRPADTEFRTQLELPLTSGGFYGQRFPLRQ